MGAMLSNRLSRRTESALTARFLALGRSCCVKVAPYRWAPALPEAHALVLTGLDEVTGCATEESGSSPAMPAGTFLSLIVMCF
jgi:hypothetical protein